MIPALLSELAVACQGQLQGPDCRIETVSTDTRHLPPAALFVALQGERFDAHDFVVEAEAQGAQALVVSRPVNTRLPCIRVSDTRLALGQLGRFNRERCSLQRVALTGSCGKTTVKQLLASILAQAGSTLATHGNLNNEIGVPLTLLQLDASHRYAVLELGANHLGEIAYTASLVQPDLALVTNVMPAHLEGFGSLDGVLAAKSEIYQALPESGQALISLDSPYAEHWLALNAGRAKTTFGLNPQADVRATDLELRTLDGSRFRLWLGTESWPAQIALPGQHNVFNAVAAAAAAWKLGLSPQQILVGLAQATNVGGRLKIQSGIYGIKLIDDSYNANPGSVRAAIDVLAGLKGARYLVLGDMGELGAEAARFHAEVGAYAQASGIERFYAWGPLMQHAVAGFRGGQHFTDRQQLLAALKAEINAESTVLIKGSRSARMDEVVAGLKA